MTHRPTGPGRAQITPTRGNGLFARLYNFDIDGAALKPQHRQWLNSHVVPMLNAGGSISLYGATSRSASGEHNTELSRQRVNSVLVHLNNSAQGTFGLRRAEAEGEARAEARGQADGSEDEWDRAVVLLASRQPAPQPIPTVPQRRPRQRPQVSRCVERQFTKVTHESESPGDAPGLGDTAVNLLFDWLLRRIADPNLHESERERQFRDTPDNWAVNRVNVIKIVRRVNHPRGAVQIESIRMFYEWGRPQMHVMIHTSTMYRLTGSSIPPRQKIEFVTRREADESPFLNPANLDSNHSILVPAGQP